MRVNARLYAYMNDSNMNTIAHDAANTTSASRILSKKVDRVATPIASINAHVNAPSNFQSALKRRNKP